MATERYFSAADLPRFSVTTTNEGLHVASSVRVIEALGDPVGELAEGLPIWNDPDNDVEHGLEYSDHPEIQAIACFAGGSVVNDSLSIVFSQHLKNYRGSDRSPVVTPQRPEPTTNCARLPHLVSYQDANKVDDVVQWELMPSERVQEWLGRELTGQDLVEASLAEIIALRQQHRESRLPSTAQHRELERRLRGRYLSIRFVYQNIPLFEDLL